MANSRKRFLWITALESSLAYEAEGLYLSTMVPIRTTSKSEPLIVFKVLNSSSFQRGSGAPLRNQLEPLSASIIPCFFNALRITCIAGEKREMSKEAFKRTRIPMGGRLGSVLLLAKWRAG